MLLNEADAKALTEKILSFVTAADATVSVGSDKLSHLRFAGNNFLTSGTRVGRSANVTVWIDGKSGSASTNELLTSLATPAAVVAPNGPLPPPRIAFAVARN